MRGRPFRLSRRAALRAGGYALALPWLEAMSPTRVRAAVTEPRALFLYFPSGYRKGEWLEGKPGVSSTFKLPAIAQALEPFKKKLTVITGLTNQPAQEGVATAGGIHARGTGCSLVASPLTEKGFAGEGVSVDQIIAREAGEQSCIASLVLGVPGERTPNFSEEGLSAIYYNHISFAGPRSPVQKVANPSDLFLRLTTCPGAGAAPSPGRARFERSVMSAVKRQAEQLMARAGRDDRQRLDEYFNSVSELERRFLPHQGLSCAAPAEMGGADGGGTLREGARAMMDLAVIAFRCGLTRVGTLMMDGAFSKRNFGLPEIGGVNYIHGLSHGEIGGEDADAPRWRRITTHYFELFAELLTKMDAVKEGTGTLLDNSVVFIGSEFGDGNTHGCDDLPIIVAGGGAGRLRPGRHVAVAKRTPVANLLLTILQVMGCPRTRFGDSTAPLAGLA
jgi:Protein of unknown function (DUF1552)